MLIRRGLIQARCFATSSRMQFKFKFTDEMAAEFKAKKAAEEKKPEPELAQHTRESSLIMARVSSERYQKIIKVGVPKHRLNEFLLMYIRESESIYAYDELEECQPGDLVLLRRQTETTDDIVNHKVEKVVYTRGKFIDPLTGRRSFGLYYDDDVEKLEKIKLDV